MSKNTTKHYQKTLGNVFVLEPNPKTPDDLREGFTKNNGICDHDHTWREGGVRQVVWLY